jgi:hypothetical protein
MAPTLPQLLVRTIGLLLESDRDHRIWEQSYFTTR